MVRKNCLKVEPEEVMSVDEQIIPSKTKRSGIRQYNPKKPIKWGFKMLVRAGASGTMYDFFLYSGKESTGGDKCSSEGSVMRLVKHLPQNAFFTVCFDNWFTTLPLMLKLKTLGIISVGTIRSNRIQNCPPIRHRKGYEEIWTRFLFIPGRRKLCLMVMKWLDNKPVHVTSNHGTAEISSKVKCWDGRSKSHVLVDCPDIVKKYNSAMGGVDLADMLISLYRTPYKTRRWYLRVVAHLLDVCKVNAWLLYRRHADQLQIPSRRQIKLAEFSSKIGHALIQRGKPVDRQVGRPVKRVSDERIETRGKQPKTPAPQDDIRFDEVGHWPQRESKKGKCRLCKMTCRVKCLKCSRSHGDKDGSVYLCLEQERNCFHSYHDKTFYLV